MQYGMAIDLRKCFGCQTCAASCKNANNLPDGIWWNTVYTRGGETIDTASGTYPNCELYHQPVACQHCSNPACVEVCPTGATWKDEETGIVMQDSEVCIGCKLCIDICPYDVRRYIDGDPAWIVGFATGFADAPTHVGNAVGKCTMCSNLVAKGEEPMCVQACIGKARIFGDLDDPNSEISKLIASRESERYLADAGTSPNVYYLK